MKRAISLHHKRKSEMNLKKVQIEFLSVFFEWKHCLHRNHPSCLLTVMFCCLGIWKRSSQTQEAGCYFSVRGKCSYLTYQTVKPQLVPVKLCWKSTAFCCHFGRWEREEWKEASDCWVFESVSMLEFFEKQVPKHIQRDSPRKKLKHLSVLFKLQDSSVKDELL